MKYSPSLPHLGSGKNNQGISPCIVYLTLTYYPSKPTWYPSKVDILNTLSSSLNLFTAARWRSPSQGTGSSMHAQLPGVGTHTSSIKV